MDIDVIIVGGGNAGFISALMLRASLKCKSIKVIESKKIGTVGVGESSTEHFAGFCDSVGIDILELILRAKATFKNGVYFSKWSDEDFLHNVDTTTVGHSAGYHFPYLHQTDVNRRPNIEMNRKGAWENQVPLSFFNDMGNSPTNQFHFDTLELNNYLREKCIERGIEVVDDELQGARIDHETGDIDILSGKIKEYKADFYIDCSGFARLLLGKTLGVKWKSYSEYLPLNSAISFPTEEMEEYNIYTKSTARDYGWSWQIPTQDRTGNGYVFCDRFIDEDQAHQEMEKAYGRKLDIAKTFKFDAGRMEKAWYKNCYGLGLSQSFVEPLEATSIGSVIQQMFAFIHYLPSNSVDECNQAVNDIFDNIFDYVQAHYLVKREDTPFWKEVKYDLKLTPSLESQLNVWKGRFPQGADLTFKWGLFNSINYILILYGLKWFDNEVMSREFQHIKHMHIIDWNETSRKVPHMSHKQLIKQLVMTYNLNKEN